MMYKLNYLIRHTVNEKPKFNKQHALFASFLDKLN